MNQGSLHSYPFNKISERVTFWILPEHISLETTERSIYLQRERKKKNERNNYIKFLEPKFISEES